MLCPGSNWGTFVPQASWLDPLLENSWFTPPMNPYIVKSWVCLWFGKESIGSLWTLSQTLTLLLNSTNHMWRVDCNELIGTRLFRWVQQSGNLYSLCGIEPFPPESQKWPTSVQWRLTYLDTSYSQRSLRIFTLASLAKCRIVFRVEFRFRCGRAAMTRYNIIVIRLHVAKWQLSRSSSVYDITTTDAWLPQHKTDPAVNVNNLPFSRR